MSGHALAAESRAAGRPTPVRVLLVVLGFLRITPPVHCKARYRRSWSVRRGRGMVQIRIHGRLRWQYDDRDGLRRRYVFDAEIRPLAHRVP
jgi:hypothetical protein